MRFEEDKYFTWLCDQVNMTGEIPETEYNKLLCFLYHYPFSWTIENDENRALDGVGLKYRYARIVAPHEDLIEDTVDQLDNSCSVLEMMIALAIRCEESIMEDPEYGDRTAQWFWGMIRNLGLGALYDDRFDYEEAEYVVDCFLRREYEPDGRGGLFTVKNPPTDLRDVEIWYQLCWFLDSKY